MFKYYLIYESTQVETSTYPKYIVENKLVAEDICERFSGLYFKEVEKECVADNSIKCPYCGESYYKEGYMTSTALYCPPVYRNGININPNINTYTVACKCLACGKSFNLVTKLGNTVVERCDIGEVQHA